MRQDPFPRSFSESEADSQLWRQQKGDVTPRPPGVRPDGSVAAWPREPAPNISLPVEGQVVKAQQINEAASNLQRCELNSA